MSEYEVTQGQWIVDNASNKGTKEGPAFHRYGGLHQDCVNREDGQKPESN
jgi:hypothetical protein